MGAISDTSSIEVLKEFLNDSARCVRETCEIAISKVQWDNSEEGKEHHERLDNELQYASTLPVLLEFFLPTLNYFFPGNTLQSTPRLHLQDCCGALQK